MLQIPAQQIDASRFATFVTDARPPLAAGNAGEAAVLVRAGLELWSGEPLGGPDEAGFAVEDVGRLQEQRLEACELLYEADLGAGEAAATVTAVRAFVAHHPFRERAWCALILALYRSGRQADALAAARELRETLAEGMGLDPSPEVQQLENRILRHDPALARPLPRPSDVAGAGTQVATAGAPERVTEDAVLARTRLYRAVVVLLAAARADRPVAIVLDDAHWLDRETLDLLQSQYRPPRTSAWAAH